MNRSRVQQLLGGLWGGQGLGDLPETCVLDYWQGAWGLTGAGGKWSRFCSNTAGQQVSAGRALFLSNFLRVE